MHYYYYITIEYIAWEKSLCPCCKEKKGDVLSLHQGTRRLRVLPALSSDSFPVLPLVLQGTSCISTSPLLCRSAVHTIDPCKMFISKSIPGDIIQLLPKCWWCQRWRNSWEWCGTGAVGFISLLMMCLDGRA